MENSRFVITEDFRMKIVNFLKIYGYYNGVLSKIDIEKKYISGELLLIDIIKNKKDFKELKLSINKVLDYCYENNFKEMESVVINFYKIECKVLRKQFGNFFERLG